MEIRRVSSLGISKDSKNIVYKVTTPSIEENKSNSKFYIIPINGGTPTEIKESQKDKIFRLTGSTCL
jgi:hypothetical protein